MNFDLQIIISGLSLLCLHDDCAAPDGTGEILMIDATRKAWACSRPYCPDLDCPLGSTLTCVPEDLRSCPDDYAPKCGGTMDKYLLCKHEDHDLFGPLCEGKPYYCKDSAGEAVTTTCKSRDAEEIGTHKPRLIFPLAQLWTSSLEPFEVILGPNDESLGVWDISNRCLRIEYEAGSAFHPRPGQLDGDREPGQPTDSSSAPAKEAFGWVPSPTDLSRHASALQDTVKEMPNGDVAGGLVIARILFEKGTLQAGVFRKDQTKQPPNFLRYMACPDLRPVSDETAAFPKSLPETVLLSDRSRASVQGVGLRVTSCEEDVMQRKVYLILQPVQGQLKMILANLPDATKSVDPAAAKAHSHFRWFYELFVLTGEYWTNSLPVPVQPKEGADDPEHGYLCPLGTHVADTNKFCPPATYP